MTAPDASHSPSVAVDPALEPLQRTWERRGQSNPFGFTPIGRASVLPQPIDYYRSGVRSVQDWLHQLHQQGVPVILGRALDFGCGAGRLTHALADHFAQVDGVDLSRSMLATAQAVENWNVAFHHNTKTDLRLFDDQSFDLAVAIDTIDLLPRDLGASYLGELARVLKPGGLLLINPGRNDDARPRSGLSRVRGWLRPDEAGALSARDLETCMVGLNLEIVTTLGHARDAVLVARRRPAAIRRPATPSQQRRPGVIEHLLQAWQQALGPRLAALTEAWRDCWPAFVASRGLILVVTFLTIHAMPSPPGARHAETIADAFTRWDYHWYASIVLDGYVYKPDAQCNVIFLPLFPILMGMVSLTGIKLKFAGLLVSNLALLGGALVLWKWVRQTTDQRTARLAVWLLMLGPVSFFFSIPYSEATFFLGAVGALYAAQTNRWWVAGLAGAAAAATRSVGVLLVVPLLLSAWAARDRVGPWWIGNNRRRLLAACLPLAGTAVYLGILAWSFGDPFLYTKVEHHWGRVLMPFWETFAHPNVAILPLFYQVWLRAPIVLGGLLVLYGIRRRIAPPLLAMCTVFLVIYTSTGTLEATPRYLSVVVPIYLLGAIWLARHPRWTIPTLVGSAVLLTFSVGMFANGYWFT